MKKTLIALMLCLVSFAFVQAETKTVFCELVGYENIFKGTVKVSADFGTTNMYHRETLTDETGKAISFNSMVDAMNYMGEKGWKFEQAYVISSQNGGVYHWLLSKEINEETSSNPQDEVK